MKLRLVGLEPESARIRRRREEIQKRSGSGIDYDWPLISVDRVDRPMLMALDDPLQGREKKKDLSFWQFAYLQGLVCFVLGFDTIE